MSKQPTIFKWRKRPDNILAVKAIVEKPTFKICFFAKYFRQRLLSVVNMGLHAAIIRLSPLIHEGEQRYTPYIVGDPRMVSLVSSLCDPPFEKSCLHPCSLLLPLFSFSGIDVKGNKRLSRNPSASNLSLRPCRYLSTVTRNSGRGSVDGVRRERLQRFATFDLLSVQRRLEAR